jgi:hypothetical protein
MTGQGITTELGEISAEKIDSIYTFKGEDYYCSVCSLNSFSGNVRQIRREDLEQLY